jgi:hypothetical protein
MYVCAIPYASSRPATGLMHTTLYKRLALWQATHAIREIERRRRRGRVTEVLLYRYINEVFLRGGKGALAINWFEITLVQATTGEQLYHNSFITNHSITDDNVADLAQAGRGRWKIENENNHVLKTKGYHIEHNFGHGQQYLAAFLSASISSPFFSIPSSSGAMTNMCCCAKY